MIWSRIAASTASDPRACRSGRAFEATTYGGEVGTFSVSHRHDEAGSGEDVNLAEFDRLILVDG